MSVKSEKVRERNHAQLRSIETELRNTLDGVNGLVDRLSRAATARDCKTARLNFDQAQLAFRSIGLKLGKAEVLHRKLKLPPGAIVELAPIVAVPKRPEVKVKAEKKVTAEKKVKAEKKAKPAAKKANAKGKK